MIFVILKKAKTESTVSVLTEAKRESAVTVVILKRESTVSFII